MSTTTTTTPAVARVLERVNAKRNGQGWIAPCPAHDDRKPSLSIKTGDDGRALVHCHAGCSVDDVLAALHLEARDLFADNGNGHAARNGNGKPAAKVRKGKLHPTPERAAAAALWTVQQDRGENWTPGGTWPYHHDVIEYARVLRFNAPDMQDKTYRPIHCDGNGWRVGDPLKWWPYRGDDLAADAVPWIVEGEKTADALWSVGIPAITSAHGAKSPELTDWSGVASRTEFIIWPDRNSAGKKYAQAVAAILTKLNPAARIRIVTPPDELPDGGDAADYIEARECADPDDIRRSIEALAEAAPLWTPPAEAPTKEAEELTSAPVLVNLGDVVAQPIRWLWPNRIPIGKLTMFAGDPGLGKSFITLDLTARVTTGVGWPDMPGERFAPGGVVLLSAEDDLSDTIKPRLDAAGADCRRVTALQAVEHIDTKTGAKVRTGYTLADLPALEHAIDATPDCRAVIVDPISAYLGGTDSHVNAEVRSALTPLAELAARHSVALICVTHLRKGEGAAIYRAMGSLAFVAAARTVWAVTRDKADESGRRRLFLPVKSNISTDTHGLAYTIDGNPPSIRWEAEPVTLTADDAMSADKGKPGPDADERDAAAEWLRRALADGPRLATEVKEEAREAQGISSRTLDRAKREANVTAYRPENPGPWYWRLAEAERREHNAK